VLQRSKSAVGVVIVGLVPAIMGGPVFAVVIAALCLIGFYEYNTMAAKLGRNPVPAGYIVVPVAAFSALIDAGFYGLLAITAAAIAIPVTVEILQTDLEGSFVDWSLATTGALYLAIPTFSTIALRRFDGDISASWLDDVADWSALGWEPAPRGLAWILIVILVTWLSDTGAYLTGKNFGTHKLITHVSPNKTWEGLIGGLVLATITSVLCAWLFGLDINFALAALVGLALAIIGVFGDLTESLIKRQAVVKDSGTLIPGHGGMLDRLDALLFTFPAGLFVAHLIDRYLT
jgi:phosphatidate cytidylyltransferase